MIPLRRLFTVRSHLDMWRGSWSRLTSPSTALSDQIAHLRWAVPLFALAIAVIHETIEHLWLQDAHALSFVLGTIEYGLIGPLVVWLALGWVGNKVAIKEAAERELVHAHAELTRLNRRISLLLDVNQRLGEAPDEESLAALALQLPAKIVPVVGCALVRFDHHQQPMPVEYEGKLEESVLAAWRRHLSSRFVRRSCSTCRTRTARKGQSCPVLRRMPLVNADKIICLPLTRNGRDFGILGLFLAAEQTLSDEERELLEALVAEISIAFENTRLRTRELTMFYEVNEALQMRLGFNSLMARILTKTMEASGADAGMLLLSEKEATGEGAATLIPCATAGEWKDAGRLPLVENLAAGALESGEPVLASLIASSPDTASVLCAPMIGDDGPLGALILGSHRDKAFLRQQIRLVSAIAAQAALLAQNARLYAQLEHQAILAERGRLAREMHDGLAQTLGYIKMRAGQIARWVEAGQTETAVTVLKELARTTNDAYLDLRAALDGLRLPAEVARGSSFSERLRQIITSFERQYGLAIETAIEVEPALPVPAQAHLLRLVQESLSNIQKHARANTVRLTLRMEDDRLKLAIEDDGEGFDTRQELPETRYGIRLMRERAVLLGADLQVLSAPGEGTRVFIEWPVSLAAAPHRN